MKIKNNMETSEVLNILSTYRDRLKSQYEKPGWNKWALFAAFASLVWLLFGLMEENKIETDGAFKLLIALIFLENLILQFQIFVKFISQKFKTTYIVFKEELAKRSIDLIIEVLI